jgi:hypothetical protein
MKVERQIVQACCGHKNTIFKLDRPIDQSLLQALVGKGFREWPHFTQAGMLYAANSELTVSGPFGANKLSVRCIKTGDCDQILNDLEALLINTG